MFRPTTVSLKETARASGSIVGLIQAWMEDSGPVSAELSRPPGYTAAPFEADSATPRPFLGSNLTHSLNPVSL